MTTTAPIPAPEATPRMVNPSDTASGASTEPATARAGAATAARPTLRAQAAENPLLSFFGLLIVALLTAAIASPHIRIEDISARIDDTNRRIDDTNERIDETNERIDDTNRRIDETNERIDRLEARFMEFERRVDARFDMVDARFDKLEAAVAEIDRKLTALIAHLNATAAVDDALAGRLTVPSAPEASGTSLDEPG